VIKICASPQGVAAVEENIDLDLSDIVTQGVSIESGADRIEVLVEQVANGQLTQSEELGHREFMMPRAEMI
jgi:(2R)-sulfolactate sulfo-lyase subunit beta